MKRILFVQPTLQPPGGGNAVAAWAIDALKDQHSVSVLTFTPPDFKEIDRFYGTSLEGANVRVCNTSRIIRWLLCRISDPGDIHRTSYLFRVSRCLAERYDVVISADNEADFGRRGIQYIHYPYKKLPAALDLPWRRRPWSMLTGEYQLWMLLSAFSRKRMTSNVTLVNSNWTAARVRELYEIDPLVVYPPAPGSFRDVPWNERENGFLCIGRLSPEKRHDSIIEILRGVRARGHDVHLHVVGAPDGSRGTRSERYVLEQVRQDGSWIVLNRDLSIEELATLVARHRYGIHGMTDEHFGIGIAQMVRGGCIVFVPQGGGQTEIVGNEARLVYGTTEEAVRKIVRVLDDSDQQSSLREHLNSRRGLFSVDRFRDSLQDIVSRFDGR